MAAATSISPTLASASSTTTSILCKKHCGFSIYLTSLPQHAKFQLPMWNSQLGSCKFSTWSGLRHLGVSTSHCTVKFGRQGRSRGKGVYASLFGVGAPEALVIGVVALLVFGPKGLAEVARNLGKTLRAFQPTIRELQEVSREFKSTLEREIGLDEIPNTTKPIPTPVTPAPEVSQKAINPDSSPPSSSGPSSAEEYARNSQEQVEAPAALQQKETASSESQDETQDSFPAVSDAETQEYLKKLEEEVVAVIAEKQKKAAAAAAAAAAAEKVASVTAEVKSQVSDAQEAASETFLSQYPENET